MRLTKGRIIFCVPCNVAHPFCIIFIEVSEKELIRRCRAGEGPAMKHLYERYAGRMLGVCCRYVRDRETARDLLHDGFVTVFTKIADFRGEGAFEGWLRRIFVTTALGYLRKNANLFEAHGSERAEIPDREIGALEKMSAQELLERIGRMPEGYRTVLNLYAVEGYSHREIAELLNISENTSRTQYMRAKNHLRRALDER